MSGHFTYSSSEFSLTKVQSVKQECFSMSMVETKTNCQQGEISLLFYKIFNNSNFVLKINPLFMFESFSKEDSKKLKGHL